MNSFWFLILIVAVDSNGGVLGAVIKEETENIGEVSEKNYEGTEESNGNSNNTEKDLYVIRKVVYEIGILTNADNSTDSDNKTHEQIDVSFFDPADNGTFIDLSKIPVPVETNVSGVAITGFVSSNLGNLVFPLNGSSAALNESYFPLFPDKQVKVTRNISIVDQEQSLSFLSGISDVLGLTKLTALKSKEPISTEESKSS